MATYIKPNAIKDASIEGIKIKDNSISSSKIDGTVASKNYVDALEARATNAVQITYTELKSLRDAGKLVAGTQYRITDYTCTTTQANAKSAGHQFDIIVTADDESTLNEVAKAIKHEGDTYFANSDLNAWKIWYCLDNDANRFAWADSANGKGIIYRMIDEWNNDVPYDFKNIQFKHPNDTTTYPYYYYTFASGNVADNIDNSLSIANGCYFNTIKRYIYNFKNQKLNCIIFIGGICSKNSFEIDCYDNSFLEGSSMNSFGGYCYDNSFGFGCSNNSFGHGCSNNSFGHGCSNNSFGHGCSNNTFGIFYNNNSFGIDCTYNIFGQNCNGNTVGNGCDHIRFASDSSSAATKYNYYQHNHFGDGCQYILFKGEGTASEQQQVQNYNFAQGLKGTSSAYLTIDGVRGRSFETYISKGTDGTIKESVIADTATKEYVDTELGRCAKLDEENTFTKNVVIRDDGSNEYPASIYIYPKEGDNFGSAIGALEASFAPGFYMTFRDSEGRPTGLLSFGGGAFNFLVEGGDSARIANIASPTDSTDAANKKYVDDTIKANIATHITYTDLKSLRDAGKLVPGTQYRITDYTCTTAQEGTRSAGHQFDVIVTADSKNKLNENARAIQHVDDTYFANSKLESWELKYCLDNDTERFAWADTVNGKGVIYWMKDEYDNECPYDFKNIQFKRYAVTNVTSTKLTSDALNTLKSILVKDSNGGLYFATNDSYGNFIPSNADGTSYEINENDSNWYYTFQGISSADGSTINKMYDLTVETFKLTNECISSLEGEGSGTDTEDYCRENKIEQFNQEYFVDDIYYKGRQILNNIVFIGGLNYCYYNAADSYWEYKTSSIYGNRFGVNCNSNTFGNNCYSNTFGNYCNNNTFGNDCGSNTFGNDCWHNTFGNSCSRNTFGNDCWYNTFGNSCSRNTFGNNCYYNTFGNNCYSNTFGNNCSSNTFGNNCYSNTFGNNCSSNILGNNCAFNTFGNYCHHNTFGSDLEESQFGDGVQYFSITTQQMATKPTSANTKNYIRWLIVENGVRYVNAYVTGSTSDTSYCQNVRICLGIQGVNDSNIKSFDITSCIGSNVSNVYQPANSKTTSV